jgi:hypothetical protein
MECFQPEILTHAKPWVNLEDVILSEICWATKDTHSLIRIRQGTWGSQLHGDRSRVVLAWDGERRGWGIIAEGIQVVFQGEDGGDGYTSVAYCHLNMKKMVNVMLCELRHNRCSPMERESFNSPLPTPDGWTTQPFRSFQSMVAF